MTQPGGITMTWPDYRRRQCRVDGEAVSLLPAMAEILSMLLMRRGQVVSYDELAEMLWPDPDVGAYFEHQTLKVHVSNLRARVGGAIRTIWGHGYIIDLPHAAETLAVAA